ncbi:hypothetical protein Tco_0810273 [Tanacetum coccineum]
MALESSSQQQPKLTPASNVHFECEDGHIAFNNSITLLESKIPLYNDMLYLWFVLGLDIDIVGILFSDLVTKLTTRKKGRDQNICYTRYSSLIIEHLLGEAYINENLNTIKPYHITSSTFKPSTASEVPLTSYMQKVAKLSEQTEKPLILPSKEVNTDTTIDKSFSRTSIHLGAQSKLQRNNWQEVKEEEKPSFL